MHYTEANSQNLVLPSFPSAGSSVYESGLARAADGFVCGMMAAVGFNVWEAIG